MEEPFGYAFRVYGRQGNPNEIYNPYSNEDVAIPYKLGETVVTEGEPRQRVSEMFRANDDVMRPHKGLSMVGLRDPQFSLFRPRDFHVGAYSDGVLLPFYEPGFSTTGNDARTVEALLGDKGIRLNGINGDQHLLDTDMLKAFPRWVWDKQYLAPSIESNDDAMRLLPMLHEGDYDGAIHMLKRNPRLVDALSSNRWLSPWHGNVAYRADTGKYIPRNRYNGSMELNHLPARSAFMNNMDALTLLSAVVDDAALTHGYAAPMLVEMPLSSVYKTSDRLRTDGEQDAANEIVTRQFKPVKELDPGEIEDTWLSLNRERVALNRMDNTAPDAAEQYLAQLNDIDKRAGEALNKWSDGKTILSDEEQKFIIDDMRNTLSDERYKNLRNFCTGRKLNNNVCNALTTGGTQWR